MSFVSLPARKSCSVFLCSFARFVNRFLMLKNAAVPLFFQYSCGFWIVGNVFPATVYLASNFVQKQAFALLCRRPFRLNGVFVRFASLS